MPSNGEAIRSYFEERKGALGGGGADEEEGSKWKRHLCNFTYLTVIYTIKIVVVASSSQLLFDACNIGYMYDYIFKTLIVSGVLWGGICVSQCFIVGSVLADNIAVFTLTLLVLGLVYFCAVFAGVFFLAEIYEEHPDDTIMFFHSFYTNPIFPLNCTKGQDLTVVELGMGMVKYDAFLFMLVVLMAGCMLSCTCLVACLGLLE